MTRNTCITIGIFFLCFQKIISQAIFNPQPTDFYVVDTVTINNPVVFYNPKKSGFFVSNYNVIKEANKVNTKKIFKKEDVYLLGEGSLYFFLHTKDSEKYHYPDNGDCQYEKESFKDIKGIVYRKFKKPTTKFILGLINVNYYNRKVSHVHADETIFKNFSPTMYYKIVFPLCE